MTHLKKAIDMLNGTHSTPSGIPLSAIKLQPIGSNMTQLDVGNFVILFSYDTPVAYLDNGTGIYYQTDQKFSNTTSKHINKWLAGQPAETVSQADIEALVT